MAIGVVGLPLDVHSDIYNEMRITKWNGKSCTTCKQHWLKGVGCQTVTYEKCDKSLHNVTT